MDHFNKRVNNVKVNNMMCHCDGTVNHYYETVVFCGGTVNYFMRQLTKKHCDDAVGHFDGVMFIFME